MGAAPPRSGFAGMVPLHPSFLLRGYALRGQLPFYVEKEVVFVRGFLPFT